MDRIEIDSTLLAWIRYSPDQHRLQLGFRAGKIYDYLEVPVQVYNELLLADSKGRYFNSHIRNNFRTESIPAPQN